MTDIRKNMLNRYMEEGHKGVSWLLDIEQLKGGGTIMNTWWQHEFQDDKGWCVIQKRTRWHGCQRDARGQVDTRWMAWMNNCFSI